MISCLRDISYLFIGNGSFSRSNGNLIRDLIRGFVDIEEAPFLVQLVRLGCTV